MAKNGRSVIVGGGLVFESNRAGTFMELGGDGASCKVAGGREAGWHLG